jgi:DNA-binding response OmpR family regulator
MTQQLAPATRVRFAPPLARREPATPRRKMPTATILLVEHHPLFLKIIKGILEDAHFKVLPAKSPREAKKIESGFAGPIDLLLSEVMLTRGLLGTSLAKTLKKRRPKLRILLMSSYPGGELLILNYGWHFIKHPFMAEALVGRIKDVLRSKVREQGTDHFDTRT